MHCVDIWWCFDDNACSMCAMTVAQNLVNLMCFKQHWTRPTRALLTLVKPKSDEVRWLTNVNLLTSSGSDVLNSLFQNHLNFCELWTITWWSQKLSVSQFKALHDNCEVVAMSLDQNGNCWLWSSDRLWPLLQNQLCPHSILCWLGHQKESLTNFKHCIIEVYHINCGGRFKMV